MRHAIPLALTVAAWTAAGAQDVTTSGRIAPQFVNYSVGSGSSKTKISELAIPIAIGVNLTSALALDIATAFANASVEAGGEKSSISGLTDAQVRLNYTLGGGGVVLTAGINLPSGQYKVAEDKIAAAGQIGNDFLAFPVSSFGNGFAGTGGIALAKTAGAWNVGLGASFRQSAEFGAFESGSTEFRFQPANEIRFRVGGDREVAGGRMMLGLVYSKFGEDKLDDGSPVATAYSTGDRIIGQAAFDIPMGDRQLYLAGWLLHHAAGERFDGPAGAENVENVVAALGLHAGTIFLEPSIELRLRQADGVSGSSLVFGGVRTRFNAGSLEISPSIAYGVGSVEGTDISGIKGGLSIRLLR